MAGFPTGGNKAHDFITEGRVRRLAQWVATFYVASLGLFAFDNVWLNTPTFKSKYCIDFTWIWLSGKFASSSAPAGIYDVDAFSAARALLVGPPDCSIVQVNSPPTILFFTYPLSWFPYSFGFALWVTATLALYLAAVYLIIPRWTAVIAALAPFPVWFNAYLGHDGCLTAGLIGLALVFGESESWLAASFLALLTYKPQFGILFPLALIASRNWRALGRATAACIAFVALAAIAFGYQTWPAFAHAVFNRVESLNDDPALAFPLVSPLSLLLSGVSPNIIWTIQLTISTVVAITVAILWARPIPYPLKASALAIGSLLVSPHVIGYDVCILTIGAAFLIKDSLARGFLPGEKAGLLISWLAVSRLSGPVSTMVCLVLLAYVVRRAICCVDEKLLAATVIPDKVGEQVPEMAVE